jgi:hypothetical protein
MYFFATLVLKPLISFLCIQAALTICGFGIRGFDYSRT